jgi:hypothetical protein
LAILKASKIRIEREFEQNKWKMISSNMKQNGASEEYNSVALEKAWKEMQKQKPTEDTAC